MPPLMDKWHSLKDEDKDLFPLLEVSLYVHVDSGLHVHVDSVCTCTVD